MTEPKPFWERPLGTLSRDEWEALCDGCGQCCLHKVEDADTGTIYPTNVACRLLDLKTGQCADYRHRKAQVPDCLKLTPRSVGSIGWLPQTCAYRLRAEDQPLPEWHYLVSGDREAVRRAGVSVVGKAVSELVAGPLENHIVWSGDEDFEVLGVEVVEGQGSPWDSAGNGAGDADDDGPGQRGPRR